MKNWDIYQPLLGVRSKLGSALGRGGGAWRYAALHGAAGLPAASGAGLRCQARVEDVEGWRDGAG